MKITAKIRTTAIAIAIFAVNANAQTTTTTTTRADNKATNYDQGFRLGFGLSGGYVFDDPYVAAAGGDVRLQYDLSKRYSITLTTGFTNLFTDNKFKDIGFSAPNQGRYRDLGFIPVKAGFKGFFWKDSFYAMGEAGAGFAVTNKYDQTSLILAPSIGYANKYFDISIRYEYYNDFPITNNSFTFPYKQAEGTGQLGLRIAYGFRL